MSKYYLINLAGGTIEEEKMREIPHPYLELGLHITLKTTQAFALLGLGAVGPILGLTQGKDKKEMAMKCCQMGAVGGALFGPVLSMLTMKNMSAEGAYDRAYRLRYNANQVNVDRVSLLGAAGATAAASYMFTPDQKMAPKACAVGLAGGVVLGSLYNMLFRR
ncbi:DgyrCDS930 [Dimorphilus gyrociliatus]|uniref:DgyrCDS930 n=1 Tax=Dimorphilus gyrociliatus TaxID=2664684 RepID=A0A7I8V7U3_9ANNE|nr:DgyrCDS930 [Dimorphilus gyrociliatus]